MKIRTYYVVYAYNKKAEDGTFIDGVKLEILADSEVEALEKAKALCLRPQYRVNDIIEKYLPETEDYSVFCIMAFQSLVDMGQGQSKFNDSVSLELIAKDENEALKRAEGLVKKDFYRTTAVLQKTL